MRKIISVFSFLSFLLLMGATFSSCATIEPEYLIRANRAEGFTIAYQAHFALDGYFITKISSHTYESLIFDDDSEYSLIQKRSYSFDIESSSNNPEEWNYVQNEYETESYDVQSLINDLKEMEVSYTGQIYILITTFDDYKIIEASNLDGNTVLDTKYGIFKNNEALSLSPDIKLNDLSRFYKHR